MIIEGTLREQYILAQALNIAIQQLEAVEPRVMRELSNIADMRAILEEHFYPLTGIFQVKGKWESRYESEQNI